MTDVTYGEMVGVLLDAGDDPGRPVTVVLSGQRTRCEPLMFDQATLDRGTRKLHATALAAVEFSGAMVFGNAFTRLDVTVSDHGEGLRVWAERHQHGWQSEGLTDRARAELQAQVLRAFEDRDFDAIWEQAFIAGRVRNQAADMVEQADEAERIAWWWRNAARVAGMLDQQRARIEFIHDDDRSVIVPSQWQGRTTERVKVVADVVSHTEPGPVAAGCQRGASRLAHGGYLIGYLTDGGRVLALGPELR